MSKNTGIRIEAVREVNDNGEQGYRITKIQALAAKDLPKMYQDNSERPIAILGTGWANPETRLYLYEGEKATYIFEWDYIWPHFYSCKDMKKINTHIRAAGQHLTDVNAHLAKEREAWNGKVTFVDGVEQQTETVPSENSDVVHPEDIPMPLAERIAELWGEGKLYYSDDEGHIRPLA